MPEKKVIVDKSVVDGMTYAPERTQRMAAELDGLEYVIVRTDSAGVFAGYLKERKGKEVMLFNARRLWYWSGASSLSQLSVDGSSKPDECKFPCEVERIELMEAIEILPVTEKAKKCFDSIAVWKN